MVRKLDRLSEAVTFSVLLEQKQKIITVKSVRNSVTGFVLLSMFSHLKNKLPSGDFELILKHILLPPNNPHRLIATNKFG